jgi:LPXTG-motif cell wall-anchored protein
VAPTTTGGTPSSSTTPDVSVSGVQVSSDVVAQVTSGTLPFTGMSTTQMAIITAGLVALGLVLVALSRRGEEKNPARSWN